MTLIYMIRHGEASAGWDTHPDPGLSDLGREQAVQARDNLLALRSDPMPIVTSPLKRCVETTVPLAERWGVAPIIEPRIIEVPSPLADLKARTIWLRGMMQGRWSNVEIPTDATPGFAQTLINWRQGVLEAMLAVQQDSVMFGHFIVINAAAGLATGSDNVVLFKPDNASITIFETDGKRLKLVEQGGEAETKVN